MMPSAETRQRGLELKEERSALLSWAADVSGLPLQHISELQNGAVFCCIISLICDLDLSLVNYEAEEECECLANYRLLQSVAKARRVRGLNHKAKLSHWGRLAAYEEDAWEFLAVLRRCLKRAGKAFVCAEFEADATPPPPPLYSRKGKKKRLASTSAENFSARYRSKPCNMFQDCTLPQKSSLEVAEVQTSLPMGERVKRLTEVLFNSNISDDDECRITTEQIDSPASERDVSPSSRRFERKCSGASTVSANDPASPHSSVSDQEAAALRLLHQQVLQGRLCSV